MTKCSFCGVESDQPPGDGCHSCLQGVMVRIREVLRGIFL